MWKALVFSTILAAMAGFAQDINPSVPFARIMNPAFAQDFSSVTIATQARFVAPNPPPGAALDGTLAKATEGMAAFQVLPPGQTVASGGRQSAVMAFLPKAEADILFDLKPGELIELTGHTFIDESGDQPVVFIADSISREPSASSG